jgi:hypothetical protein
MVDIACLAPAQLVQSFQRSGLKQTLEATKTNMCFSSSSSSRSSSSSADLSAGTEDAHDVLSAVEVDGPFSSSGGGGSGGGAGLSAGFKVAQDLLLAVEVDGPFSSSSSGGGADLSAGFEDARDLLLAVEVDGPSHVAVNCWGHALGSTVSRSWLLQQQGWAVLEVPWWEWEAKG